MYKEFHKELRNKNIKITFEKGKIQYHGPKDNIDDELISKLRKYKSNLIKDYWPKECHHIMPFNTNGNKTPLILLHMGDFIEVVKSFEPDRPLYGMYYLGSEGEKQKYRTVQEFAEVYIEQLLKIIPNGPFYLGGMSFGGIIAYEMAIRLKKMGHEVPLLIIGDVALLKNIKREKHTKFYNKIYYTGYHLLKNIYYDIIYHYKTLKKELFPSLFYQMDIQKRSEYAVLRYSRINKKYHPKVIFEGNTLMFKSEQNNIKTKYLGWEKICKNISVISFDGDHRSMFEDNNTVNFLKNNILNWIKKAEEIDKNTKN